MTIKKNFIRIALATALYLALPSELLATTNDFGGDIIIKESERIQLFLLHPTILRIIGVMGLTWGVIQAILGSKIKPLLMWAGIAVAINAIPAFIKVVFEGRGILLP